VLHNYLICALRNFARSKLYASISILGLAIGLCAAILMSLVIRNQLGYDRFVPGFENIYTCVSALAPKGRTVEYSNLTHSGVAELLKSKFSEIDGATRLASQEVLLQRGETVAKENIYWADPNFFELLQLPVLSGTLATALRRPDGVVFTRTMARKYFDYD
jgi:putative ABC transport system permease protein